jgi:hypothetical protein
MGSQLAKKPTTNGTNKVNEHKNGVGNVHHLLERFERTDRPKAMKKKREKTLSASKIDKSIGTDNGLLSSSASVRHLVVRSGSTKIDSLSHDGVIHCYREDTPSKDALELREACIRRGIVSAEFHPDYVPWANPLESLQLASSDREDSPPVEPTVVDQMSEEKQQQQDSVEVQAEEHVANELVVPSNTPN